MRELLQGFIVTLRSPRAGLRLPVIRQFVKFSIVGTLNTVASTIVYTTSTRALRLDPLVANALAFLVAVTISFFLNKHWTFRDPQPQYLRQYSRFFTVSAIGLVTSETIILVLHKLLGLHDLIAFFSAIAVVLFWNFNANRAWTFPH